MGLILLAIILDISTIHVYFKTGNTKWGVLSVTFVSIGWCIQAIIGFRAADSKNALECYQSESIRAMPTWFLRTLGVLRLAPALAQLDVFRIAQIAYSQHNWRSNLMSSTDHMKLTRLLDYVFKTMPNICLHAYVLFSNQLSSDKEMDKFKGWDLISQVCVCVHVFFCLTIFLFQVGSLAVGLILLGHSISSMYENLHGVIMTTYYFIDISVHVGR
jgi:hypothetical protein